jgi:ribosomal subunit interface protein
MNIKITFTNLPKSPAVEDYVSKKLSSLSKFIKNQDDVLAEVELAKTTRRHKSGDIFKAEINLSIDGRQFYTITQKSDLYAAVDKMRDDVEREIVSNNKKYIATFRRGAAKIKDYLLFRRSK